MKIKHKNSGKIIESFPNYGKHHYYMYGYLILTFDNVVLFICTDRFGELMCDDVTWEYEIVE